MSERWDEISSLSSLRILVGMLFGPTDLFGFKLEMMLEISFLLVGDKKNEFEELFSVYSMFMWIVYISPCLFSNRNKVLIENICNFNWICDSFVIMF